MAYQYGAGLPLEDRIRKNVTDILERQKGTVPYDREQGVDTAWLDKTTGAISSRILTEATEMVNTRETRAVTKLSYERNGTIKVEVNLND